MFSVIIIAYFSFLSRPFLKFLVIVIVFKKVVDFFNKIAHNEFVKKLNKSVILK